MKDLKGEVHFKERLQGSQACWKERQRNERCKEDAGRGQVIDSVSQATEEFILF